MLFVFLFEQNSALEILKRKRRVVPYIGLTEHFTHLNSLLEKEAQVKQLAQGHTATQWKSQCSKPVRLAPSPPCLSAVPLCALANIACGLLCSLFSGTPKHSHPGPGSQLAHGLMPLLSTRLTAPPMWLLRVTVVHLEMVTYRDHRAVCVCGGGEGWVGGVLTERVYFLF